MLTLFFVLVMFALSIAQLVAGFEGISSWAGPWWAWGAVLIALSMRFTLPLTIGAFYGAWHVWGWHWAIAAVFAAPGLLFMVPGVATAMVGSVRRRA